MMKTIVYFRAASKALDAVGEPMQTRIYEELAAYALGKPCDTKALKGTDGVRMRVGEYRILFEESETTIHVKIIGHRSSVYR